MTSFCSCKPSGLNRVNSPRLYVFRKLVRKNLLLSQHVFKAFPFGVATRLRRNCSEEVFPAKRMAEYKEYLVNQGYPSKLVLEFFKPFTILRNDLLRNRGKETKKLFPFVITFNPN